MSVRPATSADLPALSQTLQRAFAANPLNCWIYPRAASRARWSRRFFAWQLRRLLPQDVTWTTGDAAGAAIWALPGRWRETPREALGLATASLPGVLPRLPLVLSGLERIERRHPDAHHLYLAVLGVDPSRQGEGLGSALIRAGLDVCDRDGLAAYLETDTERNVAFYSRHGFRVREQIRMPRGGPPVWLMWRDPA